MKNIIKTVGVVAVALFAIVPQFALAATLNNHSLDFPTLETKNETQNPNSTTGWSTAASASAGERVSFHIYYHNNSSETARNLHVRLSPQSTSSGTSQTFTAYVWADNASQVVGSATVTLSSSQTLTFLPGTVKWFPHAATTLTTSPLNQSETAIFASTGLNLGDIGADLNTFYNQGAVTLTFQVGSTSGGQVQVPSVTTNTATNITTTSATLGGYVNPNGTSDTTRWFEMGTTQSLGIATPHIAQGTSAVNYTVAVSSLAQNTTYYYRAAAQNSAGTVYGSILSFTTTGSGCTYNCNQNLPTVTTNTATNVTGTYATLNGYVNPNSTSDTTRWFEWGTSPAFNNSTGHISQGSSAGSFSEQVSGLAQNTIYYYRAVAQNSSGTAYGTILSFTTTGGGCTYNCNQNLPSVTTYSVQSATDGFAILQGYVNPNNTTDTTRWFEWGSGTGLGNTTTKLSHGSSAGNFTDTITGLSQNATYYYRAVAQNSAGTAYGSTLSFTTTGSGCTYNCNQTPFVSTQAATNISDTYATFNGYVNPNSMSNTQYWFEWGTSYSLGNSTQRTYAGTIATNFNSTVSGLAPNTTYYFRAAAMTSGGTAYGSILSFATTGGNYQPQGSVPTAITTIATETTQTSAKLNALGLISGNVSTQGWFEWGTSYSLGNQTVTQTIGSAPSVAFSQYLTTLSPRTTYYYRAVVSNTYGVSRGAILSFTTGGTQVVYQPPVVVQQPPQVITITQPRVVVQGVTSPVEITITGLRETVLVGDTITYLIHYAHKGTTQLNNVILRVMLPKEMQFLGSSGGSFSANDNTLTLQIGTLRPGDAGDLSVQARVLPGTSVGKTLVTSVVLVYTDTSTNTQGDAIAYAVHTVTGGPSNLGLGASVGGFFPTNALGWLLLLALVIVIIALLMFIMSARRRTDEARMRAQI